MPGTAGRAHGARASGARSRARDETLERLRDELLIAAPAALLLAIARRLRARRGGAAAGRGDAPPRRGDLGATTPDEPPAGAARRDDELSRLAETLNDMLDRLEAAFEHERRFVADASHELRTPLALLRTELELALRRPRSHDELEDGAALGGRGDRAADASSRRTCC